MFFFCSFLECSPGFEAVFPDYMVRAPSVLIDGTVHLRIIQPWWPCSYWSLWWRLGIPPKKANWLWTTSRGLRKNNNLLGPTELCFYMLLLRSDSFKPMIGYHITYMNAYESIWINMIPCGTISNHPVFDRFLRIDGEIHMVHNRPPTYMSVSKASQL